MIEKYYAPKKIKPRHFVLMRRLLAGLTLSQAAKECGLTVSRASIIVNTIRFQALMKAELEHLQDCFCKAEASKSTVNKARDTIMLEASKSIDKIVELRDSAESAKVQLDSAVEILDRAGLVKTDKVQAKVEMDIPDSLAFALELSMKKAEKKKEAG